MSAPTREQLLEAYAIDDRATPRVRMNFVMSLDGAVTLEGRSGGLGDEHDRLAMQVLRTLADVVLIGAGTVRVEGYGGLQVGEADAAWRRAHGLPRSPGSAWSRRGSASRPSIRSSRMPWNARSS